MVHLFKSNKDYIYDSLFFTNCGHCGKRVIVEIPEEFERHKHHGAFTCNDCVPEFSPARNDIDESTFTDISYNLWNSK